MGIRGRNAHRLTAGVHFVGCLHEYVLTMLASSRTLWRSRPVAADTQVMFDTSLSSVLPEIEAGVCFSLDGCHHHGEDFKIRCISYYHRMEYRGFPTQAAITQAAPFSFRRVIRKKLSTKREYHAVARLLAVFLSISFEAIVLVNGDQP